MQHQYPDGSTDSTPKSRTGNSRRTNSTSSTTSNTTESISNTTTKPTTKSTTKSTNNTATKSTVKPNTNPTTTKRVSKYFIIGIILTLFNFGLYTLIARIINDNTYLWVTSFISTSFTIILAYILHSRVTWKERNPGKTGVIKFFIWNIILAIAIGPFFTWAFSLITPLYEFAYQISSAIHLPFDYNFVQSTGVFILTSIVSMLLNFLFYDRFVFSKPQNSV